MSSLEQKYLLGLTLVPGLGSARIKLLLEHLGTAREVWSLTDGQIRALSLPSDVRDSFIESRKKIDLAKQLDMVSASKASLLTIEDFGYPPLLKEIYDPPIVLYVRGVLSASSSKIAVVGARLMTTYGHQVTESLTTELVANGLTIVSGLARGVDSMAHRTALRSGGQTIAVLGSGLNFIYPPENKHLAEEASNQGALISEFPIDSPPARGTFPSRNRIISGLSLGVVITEAGEDSGSLITANVAAEQGRLVFSVPGPINSRQSQGTNNLIKLGAKLVTGVGDILEELKISQTSVGAEMVEIVGSNERETKILSQLSLQPIHIDVLAKATKFAVSELGAMLTVMIISGKVADLGGSFYARKH